MPPEQREQEAGRLYDAFGASLYRYALMVLASREAAEDVIQQVFVALLERRTGAIGDEERYLPARFGTPATRCVGTGRSAGALSSR
jgi:DNA-directed RNA polymerase specialized sigma24 family protein